jgi:hypothetical protein
LDTIRRLFGIDLRLNICTILSPLAGLKINHDLNQGLTPLAISLPALRACDDGV